MKHPISIGSLPEGFSVTDPVSGFMSQYHGYSFKDEKSVWFEVICPAELMMKIYFNIPVGKNERYFTGSVSFDFDGRMVTFDRRGICDSFTEKFDRSVAEVVVEQVERVVNERNKAVAEGKSEEVPNTGIYISLKKKNEIMVSLKKGVSVDIHPAGMGMGYTFYPSVKKPYSIPATTEQKNFFGVSKLCFTHVDCD